MPKTRTFDTFSEFLRFPVLPEKSFFFQIYHAEYISMPKRDEFMRTNYRGEGRGGEVELRRSIVPFRARACKYQPATYCVAINRASTRASESYRKTRGLTDGARKYRGSCSFDSGKKKKTAIIWRARKVEKIFLRRRKKKIARARTHANVLRESFQVTNQSRKLKSPQLVNEVRYIRGERIMTLRIYLKIVV